MVNTIIEMFSYTFIIRAVIVGSLVALCSSLLGVSLVLKRYSMIGDRTITCIICSTNNSSCTKFNTTLCINTSGSNSGNIIA